MKFTTINEILRKKIIDTYYTYKQEYMPDTEDEPEIEDEFDDIDINEFEDNIDEFIEEQKIDFEEKVISRLIDDIKSSKYKRIIYLILLQDAFEYIKTEQLKNKCIGIYEKDMIVHLENLDIDRLIHLLDFDEEIFFDVITLFFEYNLQNNFNDKYRNRILIKNSNNFECLKKFKVYILNEERDVYDFLTNLHTNRYYLMSILNRNLTKKYINDEEINDNLL